VIAGIVEGASKWEGLGVHFLLHIRQGDAICHVLRCFLDENITHVYGLIDPIDDIEVIYLELILDDLETVIMHFDCTEKMDRQKNEEAMAEIEVLEKLKTGFEEEQPARMLDLTDDQQHIVKSLLLLTYKPMLYVANVSEDDIAEPDQNKHVQKVQQYAAEEDAE